MVADYNKEVEDSKIDREQAFLLFATFCGDIEKTAHACGISAPAMLKVVDDERWTEKLAPILELKRSNRPGDIERALNRALNFVQAHRFRLFLERTMRIMLGWTEDQLKTNMVTLKKHGTDKDGPITPQLSTRAFADFASALEKAHALTYMALGDTAQDRTKRKESGGETNIGDLHVALADAMAKAAASTSPRAKLLDCQLAVAEAAPVTPFRDSGTLSQ